MPDRTPDFVLGVSSKNKQTTYKLYVNGYCWEHDGTFEDTDQQVSDFHIKGEVWPNHWDRIAIKGTVSAFNTPTGEAQFEIDGESASKDEVLSHSASGGGSGGGGGSSGGSSGGDKQDASGDWNPGDTSGDRDLDPKHGVVDRDYVTSKDRSPSVGSGGNCGTVQEAMNQVPRNVEHAFEARLKKGVHSSEPGNSVNVPPINVASAHGAVRIVGDRDNPEDYVIDAKQLNFQFDAGTAQNVGLEGVTVRGTVQVRRGVLEIDSCRIVAGARWGKGDSVPIDTYNGHAQIIGGTVIKGDNAAFNFVENSSISLSGDTVVGVGGPLCTSGQHGGGLSLSGTADLSCDGRLTPSGWDQSNVIIHDPHGATDGLDAGSRAIVHGEPGWF